MSRSRRAAQGNQSPAPRQKSNLFKKPDGALRTGWLVAISLLGWAALALAFRYALMRAFGALFDAWGINASNAARAPAWARQIYVWHGSVASAVFALALLMLSAWLRRLWLPGAEPLRFSGRALALSALAGVGLALAWAIICLLPDSMRFEWPLSSPMLSARLIPLCAVSLLGILAEEAFCKRALYDGIAARWGRAWATASACAALWLMNGLRGSSAVSAVNVLLTGLVSCLLYARAGLWASAGFRWGWSVTTVFLLGFGGGADAVYRLYGVSEALMTGGDAGPAYGLWCALLLAAMAGWLAVKARRRDSAP